MGTLYGARTSSGDILLSPDGNNQSEIVVMPDDSDSVLLYKVK